MLQICSTNKGYIYYDGKIQFINIESMVCERGKGVTLICSLGGVHQQILLTDTAPVPVIYPSEDDCADERNGEQPCNIPNNNFTNLVGWNDNNYFYTITNEGIKGFSYKDIHAVRLTPVTYKNTLGEDSFARWDVEILDAPVVYAKEAQARASMDIEVVENDGSRHMRKSLVSCLSLTDEQKVLWENLKNALKSCKDANIQFFFEMNADRLYAVNRHEDVCLASYAEECDGYTSLSELVASEVLDSYSYCEEDCETGVFAKFKKN